MAGKNQTVGCSRMRKIRQSESDHAASGESRRRIINSRRRIDAVQGPSLSCPLRGKGGESLGQERKNGLPAKFENREERDGQLKKSRSELLRNILPEVQHSLVGVEKNDL